MYAETPKLITKAIIVDEIIISIFLSFSFFKLPDGSQEASVRTGLGGSKLNFRYCV